MPTEPDTLPLPLPRVIVIDDDVDTLALLGRILSTMGMDAIPAATCEAGRYAAEHLGGPDIVIADVTLPDGSGVECAAELKRLHGCSVIVLSGYAEPEDGLPTGVDAWLLKPVALGELKKTVERLLGGTPPRHEQRTA